MKINLFFYVFVFQFLLYKLQPSTSSNKTNSTSLPSPTGDVVASSIIVIPMNASNIANDSTANLSTYDMMVNYCNSLNETVNPKVLDCTSINIYCCFANYSIMQYYFTTCFYNEAQDNTQASAYFSSAIGSISNSPFMQFSVSCDSMTLGFSYIVMLIALCIILS